MVEWVPYFFIVATDGDTLVYKLGEGPPGIRIKPLSGLIAWVPQESDLGDYEIILNAYDGQETTVQSYRLELQRLGYRPQIGPLKGLAFEPGPRLVANLDFNSLVSDPDHPDWDLT